jgi:lipopolysaccharide heptosyltransferase II
MPDAGRIPGEKPWANASHVLAVRLDSLGDVLMASPAIRALKRSREGRRITLLTSPAGAAAGRLIPEVDEILVYEAPWMKATPRRTGAGPDLAMVERLGEARVDAAAIFTAYSQSPLPAALLCHLAGIPRRLAHCRENPYQLLTEHLPETEPAGGVRHEVRRQLDLVAAVGARTDDERLSLRVPPAARVRARRALETAGVPRSRPWVVVHPGASAPSRRYPPEQFAAVARGLVRELGMSVVLTGSAAERDLVRAIARAVGKGAHAMAGGLGLPALAALLEMAPLLVANNTGPVHVAAAVGTPVVDLYALTNPQHTPWAVPHRVLSHDVPCRYCYRSVCPEGHHACLREISPETVLDAARELLEGTARRVAD